MRAIYAVSAMFLLSACGAGPLKFDAASVQGKTVRFEPVAVQPFYEKTFSDSMGNALVGALVGPVHGANAAQYGSPAPDAWQPVLRAYDPTSVIADTLRPWLIEGLHWREQPIVADYYVQFSSPAWGIMHHPIRVTAYSIYYSGNMTVSNKPAGTKDAQSQVFGCHYDTDADYSYEDVLANQGAVLGEVMSKAASACVEQYSKNIVTILNAPVEAK